MVERADIFPSREKAVRAAIAMDASFAAIEHVCTADEYQLPSLGQKSLRWWIDEILDETGRRADADYDIKQAVQRKNDRRIAAEKKAAAERERIRKQPSSLPPKKRSKAAG